MIGSFAKKAILSIFLAALFAAPYAYGSPAEVGERIGPPAYKGPEGLGEVTGWIKLLKKVLEWAATSFWIFAIIMLFIAAYTYLTAAGEPEKVKKAHKLLLYAVIAIAVGLLAYGIPKLVEDFLGGGGGGAVSV